MNLKNNLINAGFEVRESELESDYIYLNNEYIGTFWKNKNKVSFYLYGNDAPPLILNVSEFIKIIKLKCFL